MVDIEDLIQSLEQGISIIHSHEIPLVLAALKAAEARRLAEKNLKHGGSIESVANSFSACNKAEETYAKEIEKCRTQ